MMTVLLITMVVLSGIHFIYESTIAPTWRLSIRYRLLAIRDRLREMKIDNHPSLNDEVFNKLNHSLNVLINNIHCVNMSIFIQAAVKESDPKKDKEIAKMEDIHNSENSEIKGIYKEISLNMMRALACNSFMFHFYLFPFYLLGFLGFVIFHKYNDVKCYVSEQILKLFVTPPRDIKSQYFNKGELVY